MRKVIYGIAGLLALVVSAAPAGAIHFYRGPASGCTAADGATTNDPVGGSGPVAATVMVMHNTFNDAATGLPVTVVDAGDAVRWMWNSSHCHSVGNKTATPGTFYSGFLYPTAAPESPAAAPGFFHYPVPDTTPSLSYTRTFTTPGTYQYACEHHGAIGMVGTVVVQ